jgi:hypothetical protein|tara:strand:- start:2980 stop:3411 length:432 start_codon:yes stop_codon:yes gene_type:complete
MPDYAAAYNTILTRFKGQMDSSRPNVKISWPNIDFDPEADFNTSTDEAWARVTVQGGEAFQASLGGTGYRRWRHLGLVTVQVFSPMGEGLQTSLDVADDVVAALEGVTTSSVEIHASSVNPIGRDGAFFQTNVRTPFRFDNQR